MTNDVLNFEIQTKDKFLICQNCQLLNKQEWKTSAQNNLTSLFFYLRRRTHSLYCFLNNVCILDFMSCISQDTLPYKGLKNRIKNVNKLTFNLKRANYTLLCDLL